MRPPRLDQLDTLDRNLVALLQANARASVAELARQLDVARTTVIARIERLERTQVIAGYSARLGQDVLDASLVAYVGIILAPKFGHDVLKRLDRMPEVQLLCAVSGEYDYVAWLRADSPGRLNDLLDEIGSLHGRNKAAQRIGTAHARRRRRKPLRHARRAGVERLRQAARTARTARAAAGSRQQAASAIPNGERP